MYPMSKFLSVAAFLPLNPSYVDTVHSGDNRNWHCCIKPLHESSEKAPCGAWLLAPVLKARMEIRKTDLKLFHKVKRLI